MRRFAGLLCGWFGLLQVLAPVVSGAEGKVDKRDAGRQVATHKQVRKIRPSHNGQSIHLNTYCLSPDGDILACVGGENVSYKRDADGNYKAEAVSGDSLVQVYSPEGELKAEWPVPFKPTAINLASDQTIFVAGDGKIARLSTKGDVLTTASIPNIGDPDEYQARALAKLKEQNAGLISRLEKQMTFAREQADKIEAIAEGERSASQKARLKAYIRQQQLFELQLESLKNQESQVDPAASASSASTVTALAVSDSHVFVCARSAAGLGYDVYRCDYDFQNPQEVLAGLGGCCGQMDIQASKDKLLTAENTKFRVGIYDEQGELLDSFGSRDRSGGAGFGSCCNPMNVRCCSNGDILTAESSIGDIKRFNSDGELLGYIGRAKISGGCKHVAVEWDSHRDRYYMMNISDSSICVLVPLAEAPEFTEDELQAKAAREGLGKKLAGEWKIPGTKATKKSSAFAIALSTLLGGEAEATAKVPTTNVAFERVHFKADGTMTIAGGMYGQWGIANWTWAPLCQNVDEHTVDFAMLTDGIEYQAFRCELLTNGGLKISVLANGQTAMTGTYERDIDETDSISISDKQPGTKEPKLEEPSGQAIDVEQ
ncbi:MAG: hypothetical protein ACK5Q5_05160, partial [Planctomycetaceae bacterium]